MEDVSAFRSAVNKVFVSDGVLLYVRKIISATRESGSFTLGASPRAMLHLLQASKAKAYICGRDYVKPDDVKSIVSKVLSHRLILTPEMRLEKKKAEDILHSLILKIPIPMEAEHGE